jgi:recombinational DNA repair ATPase RecF
MKTINKIIIKNFKFFYGEETFDFNGKNILVYGENGSGKSSLYWALYTFLQSAMKDDNEIKKYFNKDDEKKLINIHNLNDNSFIKIEIIDKDKITKTFTISNDIVNTNKDDKQILKSNLTSDFINYKLLSKIYDFKHSEDIDLWNFFSNYILDFIPYSDEYPTLKNFWDYLQKGLPRGNNNRYPTMSSKEYQNFQKELTNFNEKLNHLLIEIESKTNLILKENFQEEIQIDFEYIASSYNEFIEKTKTKRNHKTLPSKILLKVKFFGEDLAKPQSFLNEAKLTSIALSIRFAILKNRLVSEEVLKILVLDDLLISLDMSKRFEVIDFILNDEDLEDYQKIILTHDRAFFEMAKQKFSFKSSKEWKYFEMYADNFDEFEKPLILPHKDYFQKAKYYFKKYDYPACANYLRKEAERLLKKIVNNKEISCEEFNSLQSLIDKAKAQEKSKINKINQKKIIERVEKLITNEKFIEFDKSKISLSDDKRIIGEVQTELKKIKVLFDKKIENLDDSLSMLEQFKSIILNPQSHNDFTKPLYKKELEEAIKVIEKLRASIEN